MRHHIPCAAPAEKQAELIATACALVADGKGILAADESTGTIAKRFAAISVDNTEPNRRAYRDLLLTAPGIEQHISGVILFDETIRQKSADGKPFAQVLQERGIIPGIKVDKGVAPIPGTEDESSTQGLDGLAERCREYCGLGARFTKWRAVFKIASPHAPSELAIEAGAEGLARYAAIAQSEALVPIVEPEVLMDGEHTIEQAAHVTQHILSAVYKKLHEHHVLLEGTLLKPNMVTSGMQSPRQASPEDIACWTTRVLRRCVPPAVPGIVFLSGGQSEQEATDNLAAINRKASDACSPWSLSFSYGRALQHSVLKAWGGKPENVPGAQNVLLDRARANSAATRGISSSGSGASKESTFTSDYRY